MNFRKLISLLITLLVLSTVSLLGQNEYGGVVKFDKTIHDFGDVIISDGDQKCSFKVTNISKKPIVIHRVITSCGCTKPEWTKKPIIPGETGNIEIVFTNDQGPYPFDKAITTYISNLNKPVILRVRGVAHEKKKSLKEIYTHSFGGFAMRQEVVEAGQIEQGITRTESVEVANISSKSIKVDFTNLSKGLSLKLTPNTIPANGKASLQYTINTSSIPEKIWGQSSFTASAKVNGIAQKNKIKIDALIKENFSHLTETQKRVGSLAKFTTSSKSFGTIKAGEKISVSFDFKNMGKQEFIIYKIDSSEKGCEVKYSETTPSNGSDKLDVTINSAGKKGEILYILTLITNSPTRPIINLFITGTIN